MLETLSFTNHLPPKKEEAMTVESFKIKGWEERESGLIIAEHDEWVLVKHIPLDFMVDGYKLYRKKFIKSRKAREEEARMERVMRLKQIPLEAPEGFAFGSVLDILRWSEQTYGLFEFQGEEEYESYFGKENQLIDDETLMIDLIDDDGDIEEDYEFPFSLQDVRVITFATDYFYSIRLMMNSGLKV